MWESSDKAGKKRSQTITVTLEAKHAALLHPFLLAHYLPSDLRGRKTGTVRICGSLHVQIHAVWGPLTFTRVTYGLTFGI